MDRTTSGAHSVRRTGLLGNVRERLKPTAYGLPSVAALLWFPLLVLLVFAILVALDLNGSSSGQEWGWFHAGKDPGALLGEPRPVRSDEWFVQLSWSISQYNQGFPAVNPSMPGGTDLTVLYDVPTAYWTIVFRPQLWGYFFLGFSHALAWHWWLPPALTAIAAYLLVLTVNPRRSISAAILAVATVVCPMMLWWWQTSVFLSVGWPLFVMTTVIWIFRHPRLLVRLWWIATAAFFAVTLALTSYLPFILSGVWVCVLFGFGVMIDAIKKGTINRRLVFRRAAGLIAAGGVAGFFVLLQAFLHRDTLQAITATVYPGQRSEPTGALVSGDGAKALFAAPFNGALRSLPGETQLGINQSESAATFMVAAFLLPAIVLMTVLVRRATGRWSWTALSVVASTLLYLAYLFVAHWDVGARLLQLDRVPAGRARLAFAVLLPVSAAVAIHLIDRVSAKGRRAAIVSTAMTVLGINGALWLNLRGDVPNLLAADNTWRISIIALSVGTVSLLSRRLVPLGATALLIAAVSVSAGIFPVHRGVVDLYGSDAGRAVRAIDTADPGTWVGTRFPIGTSLLLQSGVSSFNVIQSYPSKSFWQKLDPTSSRANVWNRYAHLDWALGETGTTRESLVGPDHLVITMDPCSTFAQEEVDYVLATTIDDMSSPCLAPVRTIDTSAIDMFVLRIVPNRTTGAPS